VRGKKEKECSMKESSRLYRWGKREQIPGKRGAQRSSCSTTKGGRSHCLPQRRAWQCYAEKMSRANPLRTPKEGTGGKIKEEVF